jgi:hypothetical protein
MKEGNMAPAPTPFSQCKSTRFYEHPCSSVWSKEIDVATCGSAYGSATLTMTGGILVNPTTLWSWFELGSCFYNKCSYLNNFGVKTIAVNIIQSMHFFTIKKLFRHISTRKKHQKVACTCSLFLLRSEKSSRSDLFGKSAQILAKFANIAFCRFYKGK